jgi:hypothetical protein
MSTNGDDVLVPKGVRYVTRPGVTYIAPKPSVPPPAPRRPSALPPSRQPRQAQGGGVGTRKHTIQPKPATRVSKPLTQEPRVQMIATESVPYRSTAFRAPEAAQPNAALLTASYRGAGGVTSSIRSLSASAPSDDSRQMHPAQPVSPLGRPTPPARGLWTFTPPPPWMLRDDYRDVSHQAKHVRGAVVKASKAVAHEIGHARDIKDARDKAEKAMGVAQPQRVIDDAHERGFQLRQRVARPELGDAEPMGPIWGAFEGAGGGRVEFVD